MRNVVSALLSSEVASSISYFLNLFWFFDTKSHYVAQGGLELVVILLAQSLECWDYG